MAETAADVLIDTIHDWGVDVVFGMPGDGINGIMEALRTRQDRIRFVQVRHEKSAAFMAITDPRDCGRVLDEAPATPGPVVVEAVVDPYAPPMPAKITVDQARKFAQSLLKGEPNREKIALTVLADKVRELI